MLIVLPGYARLNALWVRRLKDGRPLFLRVNWWLWIELPWTEWNWYLYYVRDPQLFLCSPSPLLESWMHLVQACCRVEVRALSFSITISIVVLVSCREVVILHALLLEVLALLVGCYHCRHGWRTPACWEAGVVDSLLHPKWGLPAQGEDKEPGRDINLDRGWNCTCLLDWGIVLSSVGGVLKLKDIFLYCSHWVIHYMILWICLGPPFLKVLNIKDVSVRYFALKYFTLNAST